MAAPASSQESAAAASLESAAADSSTSSEQSGVSNAVKVKEVRDGTRVRVWWGGNGKWFDGKVIEIHRAFGEPPSWRIHYDDNEILWWYLDDPDETWKIIGQPAAEPEPKRRRLSLNAGNRRR